MDYKLETIVASIGTLATIDSEPRQVRKEATVTIDSGADVWLVLATIVIKFLLKLTHRIFSCRPIMFLAGIFQVQFLDAS